MLELLSGLKNAALFTNQTSQPNKILDILMVKVDYQFTAGFEMAIDTFKARNLLLRCVEILERMTRDDDQTERLSQLERTHVSLYPADAGNPFTFLPCHFEHFWRKIESHGVSSFLGQADGDSSCPTGDLKQAFPVTPHFGSKTPIELHLAGPIGD
jgi:hypothetical protein